MGAIIMIVYEATKQLFVEDVVQDRIEENIDRRFYERMGYQKIGTCGEEFLYILTFPNDI